jgi:hypothetical protein
VVAGGRWNADVRILRVFSQEKPRVERVTCFKLTPDLAERAAYGGDGGSILTGDMSATRGRDVALSFALARVLAVRVFVLDAAVAPVHDHLAKLRGLRLVLCVADRLLLILKDRSSPAAAFRLDAPFAVVVG